MRLNRTTVWRRVPAIAGMALLAPAAVATPLLTPAEQQPTHQHIPDVMRPKHAIINTGPDLSDGAAALESLQIALSRVADGSTYIWHRPSGVSGSVQPMVSFRRPGGQLCRHLVVELWTNDVTRKAEGIACRQARGIGDWKVELRSVGAAPDPRGSGAVSILKGRSGRLLAHEAFCLQCGLHSRARLNAS